MIGHEDLCKMKTHDTLSIIPGIEVLKVPNGWLYMIHSNKFSGGFQVVFVPYFSCDSQSTGPK